MKYSAVERVNPTVSENEYVTRDVRKRKQLFRSFLKKVDIIDMTIFVVTLGVIVSLGFAVAELVRTFAGTQTVVNAISALM